MISGTSGDNGMNYNFGDIKAKSDEGVRDMNGTLWEKSSLNFRIGKIPYKRRKIEDKNSKKKREK